MKRKAKPKDEVALDAKLTELEALIPAGRSLLKATEGASRMSAARDRRKAADRGEDEGREPRSERRSR